MKQFLVVRRQASEGCDYTIGCGIDTFTIQAEDFPHAFFKACDLSHDWEEILKENVKKLESPEEVEDYLDDWLADLPRLKGEGALSHIDIYEIGASLNAIPLLEAVHEEVRLLRVNAKKIAKKDKEFKLYLELKKKFGDKDE